MWEITLGYRRGLVWHWELVLSFCNGAADNSMDCTCSDDASESQCQCNDFDEENFILSADMETNIPKSYHHILHVTRDDDGDFEFSHDKPSGISRKVDQSAVLGTLTDAALARVFEVCEDIDMPDEADNENCQDWVWNALNEIEDVDGVDLHGDYVDTLNGIAEKEGEA